MPKVFVYGTLKAGYRNHGVLGNKAKFVGKVVTAPKYRLHDHGSYPCLVNAEKGNAIAGEVYEVPESQMGALDRLEGVPWLYQRTHVEIPGMDDEPVIGYIYQRSVSDFPDCGSSWPRSE